MYQTKAIQAKVFFYLDHTTRLSGGEIALSCALAALDRARVTPVVILAEDGSLLHTNSLKVDIYGALAAALRDLTEDPEQARLAASAPRPFTQCSTAI